MVNRCAEKNLYCNILIMVSPLIASLYSEGKEAAEEVTSLGVAVSLSKNVPKFVKINSELAYYTEIKNEDGNKKLKMLEFFKTEGESGLSFCHN